MTSRPTVYFDPAEADGKFLRRFWSKVDRRGDDECWPWLAARKPPFGYGDFYVSREGRTTASRISLALALGRPLERHESACHRCDNPPCCNPAHLFAGTQSDNAFDSIQKGRNRPVLGARNSRSVLTEEQVRDIRAHHYYLGLHADLGRHYGVAATTILRVRTGLNWRHVDEACEAGES